jgi:predicted choloylglycine hydrolase
MTQSRHLTHFPAAIERYAPRLMQEVLGIARGANQPFETILAYNLMDEEWSFRNGQLAQVPGCTAVAIEGVGIAQTMDIPSVHDGSQVALVHRPNDGPERIVFTAAGMLGLNGANAAGVGVVVNNLAQLPSSDRGLPVMFVMRSILERSTAAEASDFVETVPHAIGQHYLICGPDGILSLEAAANDVRRVPVSDHYVHANHPLVNLDRSERADDMERASNTHARFDRAADLLRSASTRGEMETVLQDREAPISCAKREGFMTFGGTSIAIGALPVVRVTAGPPHQNAWTTIDWGAPDA